MKPVIKPVCDIYLAPTMNDNNESPDLREESVETDRNVVLNTL